LKTLYDLIELSTFDNIPFVAQKIVEGFITGLHKSPFHGFSVEFAEHRIYNPGESTRFIDWKLYARTEKLFVKKFEEETNLRAYLILDTSSSMFFPTEKQIINKAAFSVFSAAALIHLLKKQRDASSLMLISDKTDFFSKPSTTQLHINYLYEQLYKLIISPIPTGKTTRLAEEIDIYAELFHKRSLIIIFSDLFYFSDPDKFINALKHLKYKKHEIIIFNTIDTKQEENLDFENRPYLFEDLETGEKIKLQPHFYNKLYKEKFEEYKKKITYSLSKYGIEVINANIRKHFAQVLLPVLIKRSKMF
jgi:uncharacterized protein (DUF58 family)